MIRKNEFIPFAVVDTHNGFYCDVFQMAFAQKANVLLVPWPWWGTKCDGHFPDHVSSGTSCIGSPSTATAESVAIRASWPLLSPTLRNRSTPQRSKCSSS